MALGRAGWLVVGAVVVILPLFPVPRWAQAADAGPLWSLNLASWGIGLAVVLVGALLAGRLSTRWRFPAIRIPIRGPWVVAVMAVVMVLMACWIMRAVFGGNPHLVDEMAQLFHARVFLSGTIAGPAPEHLQHFLLTHTWVTDSGVVSQYPPVHSIVLALGMLVGMEWFINPLAGGASLVLVYLVARGWYGPRTALIAAFLWFASAWVLFMSGTYMNHVTTVFFALAAWACLWGPPRRGSARREPGVVRTLVAGLCFSAIAGSRPLDAVVVAAPVALWLVTGFRWRVALGMLAGGLPGLAFLFWFNTELFGGPLAFGYDVLYGAEHGLGFHRDAWGLDYTPLVALSNMVSAVRRLHLYLFEWPIPALLPLGIWALVARHRHPSDRLLLTAAVAGPILYFFYWHSGSYVGPRFYYIAAPALIIGTARSLLWVRVRVRRLPTSVVRWDVMFASACAFTLVWGTVGVLPSRVASYRDGLPSFKLHPERMLEAAGVDRALVLVPESWGSRVILRLWDLGVIPGIVERAYRVIDTCELHEFAARAQADGRGAEWVTAQLEAMIDAQPNPVPVVEDSPDPTLRLRPRGEFPDACRRGVERDLQGFTTFVNLGWRNAIALDDGIVFARDLFEENAPLLETYAAWELWRYAPPREDPNGLPVLTKLRDPDGQDVGR